MFRLWSLAWFALACAPAQSTNKAIAKSPSPPTASAESFWANNPVELGRADWGRDLNAAQATSRETGKPILMLFDEVPGCNTVISYGKGTLSHPLVVDAIETAFLPVFVQNNVGGSDRVILESFGEPAWNNPVVRIVDADLKPLAPRLTGDWSVGALMTNMHAALGAAQSVAPDWLSLVINETLSDRSKAVYSMYCFWSGEAHLGSHPAVLETRTGFAQGREVVEVSYDHNRISRSELDRFAQKADAEPLQTRSVRPSLKDDRYALRKTRWASVPMTPAQAARANADLRERRDPSRWFSPRQLELYSRIAEPNPELGGLGRGDLRRSFDRVVASLHAND